MSQTYNGPGAMMRSEAGGTIVAGQQRYPNTTDNGRAPVVWRDRVGVHPATAAYCAPRKNGRAP